MSYILESIKYIFAAAGLTIVALLFAALIVLGFALGVNHLIAPTPEARDAARVPVAIGAADGCTVYRFVDGGTHYFARCGGTVTTTKNYTENCGKACTRSRKEDISTEGNK